MTAFLRDLLSRPGAVRTVILLEPDTMSAPRQYEVRPGYLFYVAIIVVVAAAAVLVAAAVLTPLRGLVFGPGADELRAASERNAVRAAALEDSLTVQAEQLRRLRALITGEPVDSVVDGAGRALADSSASQVPLPVIPARPALRTG